MDVLGAGAGAGAGQVPMAAAVAPPGAVAVAVAAPQPAAGAALQAPPNWSNLRLRWVQTLVVLGFAAAALAMFAINSSATAPALGGSCTPTAAEAAALRAAAEELLMAAAAQVLGATTAVLLETCGFQLFTVLATLLGWMTGYCATDAMWLLMACHDHAHGSREVFYCFFVGVFFWAFVVGSRISICGLCTF